MALILKNRKKGSTGLETIQVDDFAAADFSEPLLLRQILIDFQRQIRNLQGIDGNIDFHGAKLNNVDWEVVDTERQDGVLTPRLFKMALFGAFGGVAPSTQSLTVKFEEDKTSNDQDIYWQGIAVGVGASVTDSVWQISRVRIKKHSNDYLFDRADGDSLYDNKWTNYKNLIYS